MIIEAPVGERGGRNALRWQIAVILATVVIVTGISLANGESPILSGRMPDSDDYMRLVQVFQWLDTGDWWGRVLPRLNPPDGTLINWARLADLPYAALVAALSPVMGRLNAAIAAAAIIPPLLQLPIFLCVVSWAGRPVLGWRLALLCGPLALLSDFVFFQFIPGRADHHSWHVIVSTLLLGCIIRLALKPDDRVAARLAAIALALGLWFGGEAIPWLAAFNLGLAVIWLFAGRAILGPAIRLSAITLVACLVILPLAQPQAALLRIACDDFGLVYLAMPAVMLAFWVAAWLLERWCSTAWHRLGLGFAAAAILGLVFFTGFPACRGGPYGQLDGRLADVWLQHTSEMLPASALFGGLAGGAIAMIGPLLAALAIVVESIRRRGQTRQVWLVMGCFVFPALTIACLHVQVLPHAAALSAIPLVWAAADIARSPYGRGQRPWTRVISLPTTVALIYCLAAVLPPRLAEIIGQGRAAADDGAGPCDLIRISAFLSDPAGLGATVKLIAAPIDNGAELLFRTPHQVLAAPFERDVGGNLDLFDLFTAPSDDAAHAIAARRHVDIVMFCRPDAAMWLPDDPGIFLRRLQAGKIPGWLHPLAAPPESGFSVYEVTG